MVRRYSTIIIVALTAVILLLFGCSGSSTDSSSSTSSTADANSDSTLTMPPKANYTAENKYMQQAIDEARIGIYNGHGGPFGSVIVKDDTVVGSAHNRVLLNDDSTCHGEMEAIRAAEKNLGTYDLSGCDLYTTGEPCTMCLAASMWANIEHIYYGCTLEDNANIGFRDEQIDEGLGGREGIQDYMGGLDRDACIKLFEEYRNLDHVIY